MIDCIHFYRVKSLEPIRHFYEEILGFKLYKDQGKCLIFDVRFGKIGFCIHCPEVTTASCITFVYESKSAVEKMHHLLEKKGYHPGLIEKNDYFKIVHFFVKDPNGIQLEFQYFI